jgi:ATP-dependent helicase HrpB
LRTDWNIASFEQRYMTDKLPIYDIEQEIVARLKQTRRLVLQAPTGSGKSTQVPQILLNHSFLNDGEVVVLQPRRLAARLLAARVAQERKGELGGEVGYQIRFERVVGPGTRIRYVTEGVLLRQMLQDPSLKGIQAIILDEFHERHLYGDITLARALELQEKSRPDLLILVMSATLQSGLLEKYLEPCSVLASQGRTFPVEVEYLPHKPGMSDTPVWEMAAEAFRKHASSGETGDVLVFMPGSYEIQQTIDAIGHCPESKGYLLLPLHGELPPREQDAAVARYDRPKIVVSTNVAETSLTIDGIRLVIDSGQARIPRYDPERGINTLLVEKISRASADQRMGRAGRTAPGRCIRLWSSQDHWERAEHELPEVKRLDLAEVVLTLKAAGVENLRQFRWLESPSEQSLDHAEELLVDLGGLRRLEAAATPTPPPEAPPAEGTPAAAELAVPQSPAPTVLTDMGRKMLAFPLHPRYARMLLAAQDHGCVYQACLIAALTQGRDLLIRKPGKPVEELRADLLGHRASSDFWIWMRAWNYAAKNDFRQEACRKLGVHALTARQVGPLLDQFLRLAKNEGFTVEPNSPSDEAVQKCVLIGFSDRVSRRLDEGTLRCEMVHKRRGTLARESVVQHNPLFVTADVREVEGADKTLNTILSLATAIESDWLRELFPADLKVESRVYFDPMAKRVFAEEQHQFRELAIVTRRIEPPPVHEAARLLAAEVAQKHLTLRNWDESVEQWILRLNLLSKWCPNLGLTPMTAEDRHHLIEQICEGAFSYKDIKDRDVKTVVRSWLSGEQQELLDKHAPERLTFSNGRTPKIHYLSDGQPYIECRIQELFGIKTTPRIAMNNVTLLVHILAPNMRPVQITQDLVSFWREQYPKIKKELQRKYPKHEWR